MHRNTGETTVNNNVNQNTAATCKVAKIQSTLADATSLVCSMFRKSAGLLILSAAVLEMSHVGSVANASVLFFDADGADSTAVGGSGTWDTSSSLWRLATSTGALQTWTNGGGDSANLGSTAGTLTIANGVTINITGITNGLSAGGTHVIAATGTGSINLNGGNIDTGTTNNRILQITAPISGSGALTFSSNGTLMLGGTNTYLGGTILNGNSGVLELDSSGALGTTGTITFGTSTGSVLKYTSSNTTDYSNRFSTIANQLFKVDTNGQSVTWATALTSIGGSLTKSGTGTLTLSGNSSYSGDTNISAGTVSISAFGVIGGNSNLGKSGTINLGSGTGTAATLIYTGTGETTDKSLNFVSTTTGGVVIDQSGASGLLKITGNTTNAGTTKTITLQGSNGGNGWFAGNLLEGTAGAGAKLFKDGSNTWTVSGTNTFTGGTTVNAGKLVAASSSALGTAAGPVTLVGGTTLGLATDNGINAYNIGMSNGNSPTIAVGRGTSGSGNTISYTLGTLSMGNGSILSIVAGDNLTGGTPSLNFGVTTLGSSGGTSSTISPTGVNVTLASVTNNTASTKTLVLDGTSSGNFVSGVIDNGGASGIVAVTKSNSSTWTLSSVNSYTGATNITGGTLIPSQTGSISAGALSVNGAGAILSMGAVNQSVSSLATLDGGGSITGSATLTVAGNFVAKYGTVNVNLTGSGSSTFTKSTGSGGNTVTLTGTNNYGGSTTISDGTLALTGTATIANTSFIAVNNTSTFDVSGLTSTFVLGSAQTLRGTGNVVGKVTGTGAITPNTAGAIGTLTFNDDLTIGGNLNIDVNGDATGTVDLIQGIHVLNISTTTLTFANISTAAAPLNDTAYIFANYTSLIGTFATVNSLPANYSIDYNYQGLNQIALVAPEPTSLGVIGLGAMSLLSRRRRRK